MRPRPSRRGVTLIEMLVVVALVVLIMTIIVSVFRQATAAVRVSQTTNDMDQAMRRLEATLRQDLLGVTAKLTPPLDPKDNLGYLEYGENAFADAQGEDSDDWIAFTAKAPVGQPFTGRYWIPAASATAPIIISSEYAEIIYFLRNGNLYRRVLLIVPNINLHGDVSTYNVPTTYTPVGMFAGASCGWMGVNDISAHPDPNPLFLANAAPVPNSLGDLTNRQNRFARPRFTPYHFQSNSGPRIGLADDFNDDGNGNPTGNGVPDFYPTLYPNVITPNTAGSARRVLLNDPPILRAGGRDATTTATSFDRLPFPFIFPGAYSNPSTLYGVANAGRIHNVSPLNHSPLESGDSLAVPTANSQLQTYWGWPTWKETASPNWTDPISPVNTGQQTPGLSWDFTTPTPTFRALPPMTTQYRPTAQPFNDGAGSPLFASPAPLWLNSWEDDLIMTGVRSFDIKAFDQTSLAYVDLGGTTGTLASFQHDGRIPPLTTDNRFDPQSARPIGEDSASTIRLTRTFDTWSTDYANAPSTPYDPTAGPAGGNPPVYPSYPAPYPAPLRGIQIQIRLVNQPDSDRLRVMTIRHDFTDKL